MLVWTSGHLKSSKFCIWSWEHVLKSLLHALIFHHTCNPNNHMIFGVWLSLIMIDLHSSESCYFCISFEHQPIIMACSSHGRWLWLGCTLGRHLGTPVPTHRNSAAFGVAVKFGPWHESLDMRKGTLLCKHCSIAGTWISEPSSLRVEVLEKSLQLARSELAARRKIWSRSSGVGGLVCFCID